MKPISIGPKVSANKSIICFVFETNLLCIVKIFCKFQIHATKI